MKLTRILPIAVIATAALLLPAAPAMAEGRVEITLAADPSAPVVAAVEGPTQLALSGSGFQSIENGFGGMYVMFGWVDASTAWQPSAQGVTGLTYRYANDDESAPAGFQQFIAFPGSATAAEASGGEIAPDGTWATTLTVPGARFESFDRDGNAVQVDCLATQCGVITIGAHGVANSANESFTPVQFAETAAETPVASEPSAPTGTSEPMMTTMAEPGASAEPASSGSSSSAVLPIVIGSALVAVAGSITAAVVATRRRRRDKQG